MRFIKPVIAVLGHKSSGKTSVVKLIVNALKKKGLIIATAKHVPHDDFTIDRKGTDTWNHMRSGADIVMSASENEIAVMTRLTNTDFSLECLLRNSIESDVLILEGFSTQVADRRDVGKIICLRDMKEHAEYTKNISKVLFFCTLNKELKGFLKIPEDSTKISRQAVSYIDQRMNIVRIFQGLPKIDCKKCGFKTCLEMAEAIYRRNFSLKDCSVLKQAPKLKTSLKIAGETIPLQQFVAEVVRGTALGMVSNLKGVKIAGDEGVYIEIVKPKS